MCAKILPQIQTRETEEHNTVDLNNSLLQVFMLLRNESKNNFLVGGCVRDHLMNLTPKDFDIVTDIPVKKVSEMFEQNGWKVDRTGEVFLVTNISKNGYQYEIANFRADAPTSDGRRPDSVVVADIYSDAKRRDFTVNALYYDPIDDTHYDPISEVSHQSGLKDIDSLILRFVGKPKERIKEDYLRVFRFYRFLTKGFVPDKKSLKACREMFNEAYLNTTPERVRVEIERMAKL